MHALRYGGRYPGISEVGCNDEPDTSELTYTNTGLSVVAVYFVVDTPSFSGAGNFVLEWEFNYPGINCTLSSPTSCVLCGVISLTDVVSALLQLRRPL